MNYHHPPYNPEIELDQDLVDLWEMGIKFDPHDTIMLWYDVGINRFVDGENGNVVHDIHRFLKPWQIALFKKSQTSCIYPDVTNSYLVELVYPDYLYTRHS